MAFPFLRSSCLSSLFHPSKGVPGIFSPQASNTGGRTLKTEISPATFESPTLLLSASLSNVKIVAVSPHRSGLVHGMDKQSPGVVPELPGRSRDGGLQPRKVGVGGEG